MKKKVLILTGVAVALLIAVIAAALNAVFTVARVEVHFSVCSSQGEAEAVLLQGELDRRLRRQEHDLFEARRGGRGGGTLSRLPRRLGGKTLSPHGGALRGGAKRGVCLPPRERALRHPRRRGGVPLRQRAATSTAAAGRTSSSKALPFRRSARATRSRAGMRKSSLRCSPCSSETLGDARANVVSVTLSSEYDDGSLLPPRNARRGDRCRSSLPKFIRRRRRRR